MGLFNTGRTVMTRAIAITSSEEPKFAKFVLDSYRKHIIGNWGDLDESDKKANDKALKTDDRILSAYNMDDRKIYIITEWDRSYTTVMFANEY